MDQTTTLVESQRAILNILEDFSLEQERLSQTQRATLNILEDIEEEKKKMELLNIELAEGKQNLEKAFKELDSFAYSVSHDLKAPLRGIGQVADWLYSDFQDLASGEQKENLELMKNRVGRMNDLIEGILKYSRIGRAETLKEPVDLRKLVMDIVDSINVPASIEVQITKTLPTIRCVHVQIEQVFQNLIGNAICYSDKEKGLIEVGCRGEGSERVFYVKDNGPGIAEEHFERIFKIFQTLAPKDTVESTGIGLSIVKKIVELHGGRVWPESKVGEGTTFYFTLT